MIKKEEVLGIQLSVGKYGDFVDCLCGAAAAQSSQYVCVANVHMLVEAHKDPDFAEIVNAADISTPDGKPLTWAMRLLNGRKQDRVAGMELLPDLLKSSEEKKLSVFFYGGHPQLIDKTKNYLHRNYPSLKIAGMISPPFRSLTHEEDNDFINQINSAAPNFVFVVLGCPKQEKWMAANKGKVRSLMIGVGGALPVMIGEQSRAPKWMQNIGMEWLYRLAQEPRRLFRRYAVTNSIFLYLLMKETIKRKFVSGTSRRISKTTPTT